MTVWVYQLSDGMAHIELLHYMNALAPDRFPALQSRHFQNGFWWVGQDLGTNECIAFAGMVPFFGMSDGIGYLKRAYVLPRYRGQGIQLRFMQAREDRARELGWHLLISECCNNPASERNFLTAGFETFTPDQEWEKPGSIYFRKML